MERNHSEIISHFQAFAKASEFGIIKQPENTMAYKDSGAETKAHTDPASPAEAANRPETPVAPERHDPRNHPPAHRAVVVLTGLKHCGKSSVGKILAESLGRTFYDTDSLIERMTGKTARQLFIEGGAALMARKEVEVCEEVLRLCAAESFAAPFAKGTPDSAGISTAQNAGNPQNRFGPVVSTGGGFSENPAAAEILHRAGVFCYIEADFSTLYARILRSAKKDGEMPAFLRGDDPETRFREIYDARTEKYRRMADIIVTTDEAHEPEHTARLIVQSLSALGTRTAEPSGERK